MEHPFTPGTRVAFLNNPAYSQPVEKFVAKVYANGNFTLADDETRQQWVPCSYRSNNANETTWYARPTGRTSWERRQVRLWDAAYDAERAEIVATRKHETAFDAFQKRIANLRPSGVSAETLAAIEALLEAKKEG